MQSLSKKFNTMASNMATMGEALLCSLNDGPSGTPAISPEVEAKQRKQEATAKLASMLKNKPAGRQ